MDILMNYAFQIIALGTALLAAVAAPVGALSVYKGQSLIGDAIGHATFPGVVLAFMAFSTRSPAVLLVGGQTVFEHLLGMKAVLSVVIEFAGGLVFLWLVLKKKK